MPASPKHRAPQPSMPQQYQQQQRQTLESTIQPPLDSVGAFNDTLTFLPDRPNNMGDIVRPPTIPTIIEQQSTQHQRLVGPGRRSPAITGNDQRPSTQPSPTSRRDDTLPDISRDAAEQNTQEQYHEEKYDDAYFDQDLDDCLLGDHTYQEIMSSNNDGSANTLNFNDIQRPEQQEEQEDGAMYDDDEVLPPSPPRGPQVDGLLKRLAAIRGMYALFVSLS